jgi:hypothetical protein
MTFTKLLASAFLFPFAFSTAVAQDTLRHFDPNAMPPVADAYSTQGFHTGHNSYYDEEFAEQYEVSGPSEVLGLIAIHDGDEGVSSLIASYNVYEVASDGLPGTLLATQPVPYISIPVDGSPYAVTFPSAAPVSDVFFVSFDLGDYAHNDPGTNNIALTHSPDGTRPSSDFGVYGRNAIRWHDHGGTNWKDYRTENFTSYEPAVHFSLFPIMRMDPTGVVEFDQQGSAVGALFPNPAPQGHFSIPVQSAAGGEALVQIFDATGKAVAERRLALAPGTSNLDISDIRLNTGSYIVFVRIPEGSMGQKLFVR